MNNANHPARGETFLDHTGHFVANATAAAGALTGIGFTVTPYSAQVQPDTSSGQSQLTGTGNICVMLNEGYLEFLVHTADTPIGLEFKRALQRRSGLHLCAFAVANAADRHSELEASGQPMRPLAHFSRDVETTTGSATARFTVARLPEESMQEGRVQVMTHHDHTAMWQPRWTTHNNGANSLRSIVVSTPEIESTVKRFEQFLGKTATTNDTGFLIPLDRGSLDIRSAKNAAALTGQSIEPERSGFVALRIGVPNLAAITAIADGAAKHENEGLVVPFHPALGPGAWIFEQTL